MISAEMDYPLPELLLCAGLLFILLVESVAHRIFGKHGHGHSHFSSQDRIEDATNTSSDNSAYESDAGDYSTKIRHPGGSLSSSDSDSYSYKPAVKSSTPRSERKEKKLLTSLRSFLMVLALSIPSNILWMERASTIKKLLKEVN